MLKLQPQFLVSVFIVIFERLCLPLVTSVQTYSTISLSLTVLNPPALQFWTLVIQESVLPSLANSWRRRKAIAAFDVTLYPSTLWMHYLNLLHQVSTRAASTFIEKIGVLLTNAGI